jgi:streptomycin 6-kinase
MKLSPTFISNIRDVYKEAGDAWLKDLPATLKKLAELWDFSFIKTMPDLSYNFVGLVMMHKDSKHAILKLAPHGGSLPTEIRWLRCMKKGVPEIYAVDEAHNAFLMEYLIPGNSLKSLVQEGKDDAATQIICQMIRDLQSGQPAHSGFQHLSELPKALPILRGHFDARLLSQAETWFHDLTIDRTHDVLLHGDLHHDNILASNVGWKAIDPHGYVGDPAAEVGAMIRNPFDCFPKDRPLSQIVERRLQIMAEELPFDAQRIKRWSFCMTVLSIAWTFEGHGRLAELETGVAAAIDQVKV